MEQKKIIATSEAPSAIGPYSQAVAAGNLLFISGQIPIDPATGEVVAGEIELQTIQVMQNLSAILTAAGAGFSAVIKTSIFLRDMNDFARINAVYASYFQSDFPARETVEVSRLPKDVRIEISMIAQLN